MLLALGVTALCTIVHDGRELPTQQTWIYEIIHAMQGDECLESAG